MSDLTSIDLVTIIGGLFVLAGALVNNPGVLRFGLLERRRRLSFLKRNNPAMAAFFAKTPDWAPGWAVAIALLGVAGVSAAPFVWNYLRPTDQDILVASSFLFLLTQLPVTTVSQSITRGLRPAIRDRTRLKSAASGNHWIVPSLLFQAQIYSAYSYFIIAIIVIAHASQFSSLLGVEAVIFLGVFGWFYASNLLNLRIVMEDVLFRGWLEGGGGPVRVAAYVGWHAGEETDMVGGTITGIGSSLRIKRDKDELVEELQWDQIKRLAAPE